MLIILYNTLMVCWALIFFPLIILVVLSSEKRRKTFFPRLGHIKLNQNEKQNKPVWIHALSVGETISAVPLIKQAKKCYQNRQIVFSVSTLSGYEIAYRKLKNEIDYIFFFPYDLPFSVKHITKKIDPAIVIIVESDIWPNFMFEMRNRKIPAVLTNARVSDKSFAGYKLVLKFSKSVFSAFSKICAQSEEDARRFRQIGVPSENIIVTGNIKFDQDYIPLSEDDIKKTKNALKIGSSKKILLAGSTHNDEESILCDTFLKLKKRFHDLVLIIAPRDPKRAESVRRICKSAGLSALLLKDLKNNRHDIIFDVIIVDRIGILKRLYAIADAAFIGGSFANRGGHNPLEPAAYSKPIIFGPDMSNFSDVSNMLLSSKGAFQVKNVDSLYKTFFKILDDEPTAQKMGKNAFSVFCSNKGALDKTIKVIKNLPCKP